MKADRVLILEYLQKRGFRQANMGYGLLLYAIETCIDEPRYKLFKDELCKKLADMHLHSAVGVERRICHAIATCKDDATSKLSDTEFIRQAAEFITEQRRTRPMMKYGR